MSKLIHGPSPVLCARLPHRHCSVGYVIRDVEVFPTTTVTRTGNTIYFDLSVLANCNGDYDF